MLPRGAPQSCLKCWLSDTQAVRGPHDNAAMLELKTKLPIQNQSSCQSSFVLRFQHKNVGGKTKTNDYQGGW